MIKTRADYKEMCAFYGIGSGSGTVLDQGIGIFPGGGAVANITLVTLPDSIVRSNHYVRESYIIRGSGYDCINCILRPRSTYFQNLREIIPDSFASFHPENAYLAGPPPGTDSFILYQYPGDMLDDTLNAFYKNIVDPFSMPGYVHGRLSGVSLMTSKIFRYQAYDSISSPWMGNKALVTGLKNQTLSWYPGWIDEEGDSISVRAYHMPIEIKFFNPNWYAPYFATDTLSDSLQNKIRTNLRDSTTLLQYPAGYSFGAPFGSTAPYNLSAQTGTISYRPQDSGLYYLCYAITEYRDGLPLGEITAARLAYVLDSNATLPQAGGIYQEAHSAEAGYAPISAEEDKWYLEEGSAVSFKIKVASALADAKVIITTDLNTALPGSPTLTKTGENTDSVTLSFQWVAPAGTANRIYYPYLSWRDTACGDGHLPLSQSRPFVFSVRPHPAGVSAVSGAAFGQLLVYPNPAHGSGNLRLVGGKEGRWTVSVTDALGRAVEGFSMSSNDEQAFGESLAPGFYTVTAVGPQGARLVRKWVKQ